MELIYRLPYLAGGVAALITGIMSYSAGSEMKTIYLHMTVMMLVFFILGIFIRSTVTGIEKEVQEIKEEKFKIEEIDRLRKIEDEKAAAMKQQNHPDRQTQPGKDMQPDLMQNHLTHKLNLSAGSLDDDFQPLNLSKAISTKVKE